MTGVQTCALPISQISGLRRRADERERALRRIIRECGLSTMDLEARLRTVESEMRTNNGASQSSQDDDLRSEEHTSELQSHS